MNLRIFSIRCKSFCRKLPLPTSLQSAIRILRIRSLAGSSQYQNDFIVVAVLVVAVVVVVVVVILLAGRYFVAHCAVTVYWQYLELATFYACAFHNRKTKIIRNPINANNLHSHSTKAHTQDRVSSTLSLSFSHSLTLPISTWSI